MRGVNQNLFSTVSLYKFYANVLIARLHTSYHVIEEAVSFPFPHYVTASQITSGANFRSYSGVPIFKTRWVNLER